MGVQNFDKVALAPSTTKRDFSNLPVITNIFGKVLQTALEPTGITINGHKSYDVQVVRESAYRRIALSTALGRDLGFSECYIDGSITCYDVAAFGDQIIRYMPTNKIGVVKDIILNKWYATIGRLHNPQSPENSMQVAHDHYDLPQKLYEQMLGRTMFYTCAYWPRAVNLDEAQEAKAALVAQKLNLKPGMTVLDIGGGFGSMAVYIAKHYPGVTVHVLTISEVQLAYAKSTFSGLPIEFYLRDYRFHEGQYDRIVSIGMFEHVGELNWKTFFHKLRSLLKDDGIILLHTIVRIRKSRNSAFLQKYIFPQGQLPYVGAVEQIAHETGFKIHDVHSREGLDYDRTLEEWGKNFRRWFESDATAPSLFNDAFPQYWGNLGPYERADRFRRLWEFYLAYCQAPFRAGTTYVSQFQLTKKSYEGPDLEFVR